jgi:hypothetical protein
MIDLSQRHGKHVILSGLRAVDSTRQRTVPRRIESQMRYAVSHRRPVNENLLASKKSRLFHVTGLCLLYSCFAPAGSVADEAAGMVTAPRSLAAAHPGMDADAEALGVALWSAAADGDRERLDLLLAKGAGAQSHNAVAPTSALWIASQEGHAEVVQLLLALGTNVEAEDPSDGRTALFQAAQEGHTDVVHLLLESGARVDSRSARTGATPLFMASARGNIDVVRLLLAAGANVNAVATANGIADSPLSIARKRGHVDIAELIARSGGTDP